jgi:hypothetical protein
MLVFYGHVHQAGVVPVIRSVANGDIKFHPDTTVANFVFSHTYMPPKFLLLQSKVGAEAEPFHANPEVRINFRDLAGKPVSEVQDTLLSLASNARYLRRDDKRIENFVVLPTNVFADLASSSKTSLSFELVAREIPHLSTENPPEGLDLTHALFGLEGGRWRGSASLLLRDVVRKLEEFSLSVFRVELGDVHTVELTKERANKA